MNYLNQAKAIAPEIIALRRELHRHPEMGRSEFKTAATVEAALDRLGIPHHRVAETGVVADIHGLHDGPTVALRADMDALPITEACDVPWKSENAGVMHACGHDFHTAALLGAAQLLAANRDFSGHVRLLFQPDEEGDGGAQRMIDAGAMEGVNAVFGAHVAPEHPAGTIGIRYGHAYAASNPFDVTITGLSSHGAEPHLGKDALLTACETVVALQALVSRSRSPLVPAVLTVGKLNAGTARNILADTASFSGILRCFGRENRAALVERIKNTVNGIAAAHGVKAETKIIWGYEGITNDNLMVDAFRQSAATLIGEDHIIVEQVPSMTTEDFGAFLSCAPGCFWHIGVGRPDVNNAPLHNPLFDPDESALPLASALHAQTATDLLSRL